MKNQWFISLKKREEDLFNTSGFERMVPPEGTYQADPFILQHKGTDFVFHEWYDYKKGKLAFSLIENGKLTPPETILDESYHLSFPSVFEDGGEIYMTPETGATGELRVYVAKDFPYNWEIVSVVATGGNYADPVVLKEAGYYKIFCTDSGDSNLRVFRSFSLAGPWELCLAELQKNSRAAGHFFLNKDKLLRPVQDCSEMYGRAILFRERPEKIIVERIEPDWYPGLTGTHTFNFNQNWVVIDGRIQIDA